MWRPVRRATPSLRHNCGRLNKRDSDQSTDVIAIADGRGAMCAHAHRNPVGDHPTGTSDSRRFRQAASAAPAQAGQTGKHGGSCAILQTGKETAVRRPGAQSPLATRAARRNQCARSSGPLFSGRNSWRCGSAASASVHHWASTRSAPADGGLHAQWCLALRDVTVRAFAEL